MSSKSHCFAQAGRARVVALLAGSIGLLTALEADPARADPVRAQPGRDAGQRLFEEGVAAAERKDFKEASRRFEAAYKLDPTPDALFAWAQVERLGGNCARAVPLYREFLTKGPAPEHAQAADLGLRRCAEAGTSSPPEASPEPKPAPAPVAPAVSPVATAARGEPSAGAGRGTDWLGGSLIALGTVGVGAGLALVALSVSEDRAAISAGFYEDYLAHMERGRLERALGIGIGAAGVALATVGVIRLLRARGGEAAPPHASGPPQELSGVSIAAGPRGATLVLGGRF